MENTADLTVELTKLFYKSFDVTAPPPLTDEIENLLIKGAAPNNALIVALESLNAYMNFIGMIGEDQNTVYAHFKKYKEVINLLLRYKADINFKNKENLSVLEILSRSEPGTSNIWGHEELLMEIMDLLIKYGADINGINLNRTPLIYAIDNANLTAVRSLVKLGANTESQFEGLTVLNFAKKKRGDWWAEKGEELQKRYDDIYEFLSTDKKDPRSNNKKSRWRFW